MDRREFDGRVSGNGVCRPIAAFKVEGYLYIFGDDVTDVGLGNLLGGQLARRSEVLALGTW